MATRGGRVRRGRNTAWRAAGKPSYSGDGRNMRWIGRPHYGPGLLAGTPRGEEMVYSDLSRLDRICPRAVGAFDLVLQTPRDIQWPPR